MAQDVFNAAVDALQQRPGGNGLKGIPIIAAELIVQQIQGDGNLLGMFVNKWIRRVHR